MSRVYRVLLIAEAANPEWASVPLIGWSLSQALGKVADVHIVTHVRNKEAILRAGLKEGEDVTIIDNERIAGPVWKVASLLKGGDGKGWTTLAAFSALSYYSFENEVWRLFKDDLRAGKYDLVHRVTPLSPTHQSTIAKRLKGCGVPFIIGPLNGGVPWPKGFMDRQHAEREWLAHIRSMYKWMPGYRSTLENAAAIICGSKYTLSEIPDWAQNKCIYIPENAADPDRFNAPRTRSASLPLRAAFVGRLVPYKGADILIDAARDFLAKGTLTLDIVGDGPERESLEARVRELKVEDSVRFHGWVPHEEVQSVLTNCDFMALPSVREFGGGVVIEAMVLGVTPVVADYAGPSELVDKNTGLRVPFKDKESLVRNFRHEIEALIDDPSQLDLMGAAGREAVQRKYTWSAKAEQINSVYDAVVSGKTDLRYLSLG